jgi:hypothetical protein
MRDALRARGHESRLLASTAPLLPGENLADYRCHGSTSRLQPLLEAYNPSAGRALRRALADFRPDVVHVSMFLFGQGRTFGRGRSTGWSRLRRAGYVVGAPAIPLLNLPRSLRDSARSLPPTSLAASIPSILLHVAARGAGEVAAYVTGTHGDEAFLASHEFSHRPEQGMQP